LWGDIWAQPANYRRGPGSNKVSRNRSQMRQRTRRTARRRGDIVAKRNLTSVPGTAQPKPNRFDSDAASTGRRFAASLEPKDMAQFLSAQRVRLLREVKNRNAISVADLVARLHRNRRAIDRDLDLLAGAGLLKVSYRSNPGHGRVKIVSPLASQYKLTASL
jgi:predicted transcriptional regulator